jgi:signal transduction histidine kinase
LARLLDRAEDGPFRIARLLDSAAFSVAAFERKDGDLRVIYVNDAASVQAAVRGADARGRPMTEVFPNVDPSIVERLLATPGDQATPINLRGRLPSGAAWSIDAVRLGLDQIVVFADELGEAASSRQHLDELLRDARDSARRLQLTLDLAMAFASSQSAREVVQLLLNHTLDAVEADRATLSSLEAHELVIEATYARSGELKWVGMRYPLDYIEGQPLVKEALAKRKPVVGGRLEVERAAPEFRDALNMMAQTANLPLMVKGEAAGLLVVSREGDVPFTAGEIGILELMGNAAMLALRNARLFEDLQLASAAKTQFLNMAAHELRTPVTVISGYTSMLQTTGLDDRDGTDKALAVIEQKASELAKLVDALLVAARVQSGSIGVDHQVFDIAECASQAVARARPFADLAGGTLTVMLPPHPVDAVGNPEHTGRILDNLINNAIAYSSRPARVEVHVATSDRFVEVEVHDAGRGIPSSHHAAVFEEFVRVDDGANTLAPGAGLGLYIGRRLAESMGGQLTLVSSSPGQGSVFRLRLDRPPENLSS